MPTSTDVFAQAEQEVYHAVTEWPLWLVLRQRRLEANPLTAALKQGKNDDSTPRPDGHTHQS